MKKQYYACRPTGMPEHVRVSEKTDDPRKAIQYCFGRGVAGYEAMPLGSRVSAIRVHKHFVATINQTKGWIKYVHSWQLKGKK